MVAAAAGRIRRKEMYNQTAYLDRAKELRDTAEATPDARAREYLIRAAEAYERLARQELSGRAREIPKEDAGSGSKPRERVNRQ